MTTKANFPCPLAVIVNAVLIGPKIQPSPMSGLFGRIIGPGPTQPTMAPVQRKPFFLHGRFEREG